MKNRIIIALSLLVLSSCVYTPTKIRYYDKDCDVVSKKFVLTEQINGILLGSQDKHECADKECIHLLLSNVVGAALVGPVSAIISGTIVVAGNTVYWLEKTVNCKN